MSSLSDWLAEVGLDAYAKVFEEEGFDDVESIAESTEDDLVALGVKKGHAKKLIKAAKEYTPPKPTGKAAAKGRSGTVSKGNVKLEESEDEDEEDELPSAAPVDRSKQKADFEGYLDKKGAESFIKVFSKRYFRLYEEEKKLCYFKTDKDFNEISSIEVGGILAIEKTGGKATAFHITMKTTSRVYYLNADKSDAADQWIQRLSKFIKPLVAPATAGKPVKRIQGYEDPAYVKSTRYEKKEDIEVAQKPRVDGTVSLTLFGNSAAYIQEVRDIELDANNAITIPDLPRGLQDKTVQFKSLLEPTAYVFEQSFHANPKTPEELLRHLLGKEIEVETPRDSRFKQDLKISGVVLYDQNSNSFVLHEKATNTYHFVDTKEPITYRIKGKEPEIVFRQPSLDWVIESATKKHLAEITYTAQDVAEWSVEYNALLNTVESEIELIGWYTIKNTSGKTFKDANVILIPDNRPKDKKKDATSEEKPAEEAKPAGKLGGFGFGKLAALAGGLIKSKTEEEPEQRIRKYPLSRVITLVDGETKQIRVVNAKVPIKSYDLVRFDLPKYRLKANPDGKAGPKEASITAEVIIQYTNNQESGLGIQLPAGKFNIVRREPDGLGTQPIATVSTAHEEPGNLIVHTLQKLSGVTATRKQTGFNFDFDKKLLVETIEIMVVNGKEDPVNVIVEESLFRWSNWEITGSNVPYQVHPIHPRIIQWPIKLEGAKYKKLIYTVFYSFLEVDEPQKDEEEDGKKKKK